VTSANLENTFVAAEAATGPPDTKDHPKVALAIGAHPDDTDFGCAGTAHLWSKAGWDFYYCVVTDGSKGTNDAALTSDQLPKVRQAEQRAAAAELGVKDVFFLEGHVDGELTVNRKLLGDIVRMIRKLKPYAVFTHEPQQIFHNNAFVNHNDHRATGMTTVDAIYPTARDRLNFPEHLDEGLEVHNVKDIFIWGNDHPNFASDITDAVEIKIQALLRHTSQFGGGEEFLNFVRARWKDEDGRYYERFRRVTMAR
jgi:LmbE family N-acetylglucosaminyl deacetylase